MIYQNFRIKVNGTTIPNKMIEKGSYSFAKERRDAGSVTDARGIEHPRYYGARKAVINFAIRQRNLADHRDIAFLFQTSGVVEVEYWDDYDCIYRKGSFKISTPAVSHLTISYNDIQYNSSKFALEEC